MESLQEEVVTALSPDHTLFRVGWPCTPRRRGNFVIENIYLEAASPLGLWAARRVSPSRAEVRVYPNTLSEQKGLAAFFLNRGLSGVHAQRQVGKGKEFEKLRDYIPGDSYEDIHWKATARQGHPITKVFQIERTQEVYVVLDSSRLSSREVSAPNSATQLDRFLIAALVLGLVAEKQGDRFGLLAFDDQVRRFIRSKSGKAHYGACRDALYALQPRLVNPDFAEVCSFIRLHLRRRALLIFLTNLDDPVLAESFSQNLDLIARHHLVLVNLLTLPGVGRLFTGPPAVAKDDLYQRLAGHLQWSQLRKLEQTLRRRGVALAQLDQAALCPQLISQYLGVKRRQLL